MTNKPWTNKRVTQRVSRGPHPDYQPIDDGVYNLQVVARPGGDWHCAYTDSTIRPLPEFFKDMLPLIEVVGVDEEQVRLGRLHFRWGAGPMQPIPA